ncbi:MAG: flagellar motor protein MotB [Alphaproteobacteria bacterium]|nr:flagellar motor protein MotB [Alphaproteobacteria bacterium]|tara:strand:- start:331970 stop:332665 length:696 start_codon:yes stop_codon:yes gene_type:complete
MNQWNKKPPENNSSGSQVLALGLFIMLLAFFIVLNALSTFDEQLARPVIASLERTFASRIYQDDIGQTQVQAIEQGNQEGSALQRISALFNARIPGSQVMRQRDGMLYVRVRSEDMIDAINSFSTQTDSANRMHMAFRDIFVAVLATQKSEYPLRMDITMNRKAGLFASEGVEARQDEVYIKTLAEVAAQLQKSGLPIQLFSVGLAQGDQKYTDISFEVYEPYDFSAGGAP